MTSDVKTPLQLVLDAIGGSKAHLAKKMGVSTQAVFNLEKRGGLLPTKRAFQMVSITGLPMELLYPQMKEQEDCKK